MDILSRGTALNGNVRVFCCCTTKLVQEAVERHNCLPTAAAALGRTLSVGCIMGTMLKDKKEKIEIQIDGNGPLGNMVVDAYYDGTVRGFVTNPKVELAKDDNPQKLDVGKAVGTNGVLRVIKDMSMKRPFISEVPLQTGEIGDDFAYYYMKSEQTPSVVSVGVLVDKDYSIKAAGALVIQMMPSATEKDVQIVEEIVAHLKPISQIIDEMKDPTEIVKAIFDDYQELATQELGFKCECNKGKFAIVLSKLPKEDLQVMIDEDHGCEVICKFCNTRYYYDEKTLQGYVKAQMACEKKQKEVAGKA
ncbi:MAG TPA: Hsp33 family molecular chaperone HslO [Erysipelotrichaceae bacterium]|nr:Hsp33 family molecular chaperone HslO [Erysipelotrichaceae bacterium]HQA84792.1 Hsp33 family molecular chaperone HslO [Erysipelotrichaceae bacterium]